MSVRRKRIVPFRRSQRLDGSASASSKRLGVCQLSGDFVDSISRKALRIASASLSQCFSRFKSARFDSGVSEQAANSAQRFACSRHSLGSPGRSLPRAVRDFSTSRSGEPSDLTLHAMLSAIFRGSAPSGASYKGPAGATAPINVSGMVSMETFSPPTMVTNVSSPVAWTL